MEDVSYWPGNICDNRGNHVHSIQGGLGMHALGTYALVHALMSSLNGCLECYDDYHCWQDNGGVVVQRRAGLRQANLLPWW